MHTLTILDKTGDTAIVFDPAKLDEGDGLRAVQEMQRMIAERSYMTIAAPSKDVPGELLNKSALKDVSGVLRANADVVMMPQLVGG